MGNLGDRGTTRGGGTPVKVIVKFDGRAIAGVTVTAQTAGRVAVPKTTGEDGVASFTLAAGHYTIQASSSVGAATKSVSVVDSTTTEIVALTLAPIAAQPGAEAPTS